MTTVSVVMIASAAARLFSAPLPNPETSASIPCEMGSRESFCPMTPVEATTTSSAEIPQCFSTSAHIFSAISTPSALQVFALPLLTITARA